MLAGRVFAVSVVLATAGCTDWRALYLTADAAVVGAADDGPDAPFTPTPVPDVPARDAPALPGPEVGDTPPARDRPPPLNPDDALVMWRFEGTGRPSATNPVHDVAPAPPDMPLEWDLTRDTQRSELRDGSVWLDGGFLRAGIRESDGLGAALVKKNSVSIEMWLRTVPNETGTILTTNGEPMPGRAFALNQQVDTIHFAVRTTATDAVGERFAPLGGMTGPPAELVGKFVFDSSKAMSMTTFHVVAVFSGADRGASLYVNGFLTQTLSHVRPNVPNPALVWSAGRNEVGVGGTFDPKAPMWKGTLMLVALYDKALAADEIRRLYGLGPIR